jgi:hypothetical protein
MPLDGEQVDTKVGTVNTTESDRVRNGIELRRK